VPWIDSPGVLAWLALPPLPQEVQELQTQLQSLGAVQQQLTAACVQLSSLQAEHQGLMELVSQQLLPARSKLAALERQQQGNSPLAWLDWSMNNC